MSVVSVVNRKRFLKQEAEKVLRGRGNLTDMKLNIDRGSEFDQLRQEIKPLEKMCLQYF
jgi:hypothetical protein